MTVYFIDPDLPTNGDGSIGSPYNTLYGITPASDCSYLIKKGTTDTWDASNHYRRFYISNLENITIGTYGDGAPPIIENYHVLDSAGDWTNLPGTDIWYSDIGTEEYDNRPIIIGFGTLTDHGERVPYIDPPGDQVIPSALGEWDYSIWDEGESSGSGDDVKNRVYVYSPSGYNPYYVYGPIYVTSNRECIIWINKSNNITVSGIHFRYAFGGVYFRSPSFSEAFSNILIEDNYFTRCWKGVASSIDDGGEYDNVEICDNTFSYCLSTGIFPNGLMPGALIHHNTLSYCCCSCSDGGIYAGYMMGESDNPIRIYLNDISNNFYGKYFPVDGGAIETDHHSEYVWIYQNALHDSPQGYVDNSGKPGIKFFLNLITGSERGVRVSDGQNLGECNTEIFNNTIPDCSEQCVNLTLNTGTPIVKNNILGALSGNTRLLNVLNQAGLVPVIDHNLWYSKGNTDFKYKGTTYSTFATYQAGSGQDANGAYGNPEFVDQSNDDYRLSIGSPGINLGEVPFEGGDGDQYDMSERKVWRDSDDSPVGPWLIGVDAGCYGFMISSFMMYDYLPQRLTADHDYVLNVQPRSTPAIVSITFNQRKLIPQYDARNYKVISPTDFPVFIVSMDFDPSDSDDIGTIYDLFLDATKAYGTKRSFKWQHPLEGYVYIVKFVEDITRTMTTSNLHGIPILRLAVLDRVD